MWRRRDPSHVIYNLGEHHGLTHNQRAEIAVLCGAVVIGLVFFFALRCGVSAFICPLWVISGHSDTSARRPLYLEILSLEYNTRAYLRVLLSNGRDLVVPSEPLSL